MKSIVENPSHVDQVDIIVGIPSYNEADVIAFPVQMADLGLRKYFHKKKSVIINVDNHSPDGTRDTFLSVKTHVPKIYVSTPKGVLGKGNNLRNLFIAAVELKAQAVVVVDADLKSITPEWIQYLGEPLFSRFNYVCPIYVRHKYDGSITNHIAYPLMRTLYGLRVRQPIGGDFGFSGRMARAFLSEKNWNETVSHFGIDIWMTTIAIARRFRVCQTFLGSPKSHRVKDPAKHLGPMFTQVVQSFFNLMIDFEYFWKDLSESRPSNIFGFGLGVDEKPQEVQVDTDALHKSFVQGFDRHGEMWEKIVPLGEFSQIEETLKMAKADFYYPSDLWARILFNFAIAYRNNEIPHRDIIEAMKPFYHSRILSFVNKTGQMGIKECEEYFEHIVRIFEEEKKYLIQRWDEDHKKLNHKLF